MAIIPETFSIIIPKRGGADSDDKGKLSAELSVVFQFQDADPDAMTFDVYNYPGIPRRGEMYFINGKFIPQFICRSVHAEKIVDRRDSNWWTVEAKYKLIGTPDFGSGETPEFDESMLTFSSGTIIVPTVAKYDYFGNKIQNSAGQLFDQPAQYDKRISTFSFTRVEYFNPNLKRILYEGAVNSVPMWGMPAYTILVQEIRASKSVVQTNNPSTQGAPIWNVSYELAIDVSTHGYDVNGNEIYGWQTAVLDCGKSGYMKDSPEELVRFRDDEELEVDEPQRLDGHGNRLDKAAQDVYLRYMLHRLENLNDLNLPNPFLI